MTTIPELQAKMAKLPTNLDRLDGIVNGPATGAGSTVVVDSGTVSSLAKLIAEFGYGPVIRDLSDVATVRAFLTANGGGPIYFEGGVYSPDFMANGVDGQIFDIPDGTTMIASGTVEIRTNNPSRGIFRHVGSGAGKVTFVGEWRFIGDFNAGGGLARPDISWQAGVDDTEAGIWINAWNLANSTRQVDAPDGVTDFKTLWNNATWNTGANESKMQSDGQFSSVNRCSGIITENSDYFNTRQARFYVENMPCAVTAQGKSLTAATYLTTNFGSAPYTAAEIEEAKAAIQTVGVHIGDIDCGPNVFAPILSKKQRDHKVGWITGETSGHRIGGAQPHGGGYFSNEESDYEETWGLHIDGVDMKNYDGGSVFKTKGVKGLSWGVMYLDSIHAALSITLGTTGVGGDLFVRNQRQTTDTRPKGAGGTYCINIVKSPGFILGGQVSVEQAAAQDAMKLISVEYSPGFKMPQGIRFKAARTTDVPIARIIGSDGCRIGLTDYEDTGGNGGAIWNVGDSSGGGSNDCVFDGFRTKGTNQLVEVKGKSSGTRVVLKSSDVEDFTTAAALVNSGLGNDNVVVLEDLAMTALTEVVAYAATDTLQTAATADFVLDFAAPAVGSDDDYGPAQNPPVGSTITIGAKTYTFQLAAALTVADRVLTETLGAADGDAATTMKNLAQAINDNGVEGVSGKYGTGTVASTEVAGQQAGTSLTVRALARGTGGNALAVSESATLLGSWLDPDGVATATLKGGGAYDAGLMNRWRSYDTTSGNCSVRLPPLGGTTPTSTWVGLYKSASANTLSILNDAGTTLWTLSSAGDGICIRPNASGTAWEVVSATPAWLATSFGGVIQKQVSPGSPSPLARSATDIAQYRNSSGSVTGAIVFSAANGLGAAMHQYRIRGHVYNATSSNVQIIDTIVQGYRSSNTATFAGLKKIVMGTHDPMIRFGQDPSGNHCVIVGDIDTIWTGYPHIVVKEALISHSATTDDDLLGWTVSLRASDLTVAGFLYLTTAITADPSASPLNATNLTSGAVPAARMPALTGEVTTTAGAVATTITSKTIAWRHSLTPDISNIILNPIFSYSPHSAGTMDGWDGTSATAVSGDIAVTTILPQTAATPFVCQKASTSGANDLTGGGSQYFPAAAGDVFYYEYYACSTSDVTGSLLFSLRTIAVGGGVATGPSQTPIVASPVSTWTKYSGYLTVALANAYGVRPYFRTQSGGVGNWFITGVRLFRVTPAHDQRYAQLAAANNFTVIQKIGTGPATTAAEYLQFVPTDYGVGKPRLAVQKAAIATHWTVSVEDSAATLGTLVLNTAQVRVPTGTVSVPGLGFVVDSTSGLYLSTSDVVVARAGVETARFASTGLQLYGANTVIDASRHHRLRSYTIATLPTASPAGQTITLTGGAIAESDGTAWKITPVVLAQSAVAVSHSGAVAEETLATVTVPAGMMGPNGSIEVECLWSMTSSANLKTMGVKFGTTPFQAGFVTTSVTFMQRTRWANRNNTSSQVGQPDNTTAMIGPSSTAVTTATKNTNNAQDITIHGTLAVGGETLTLQSYKITVFPGA